MRRAVSAAAILSLLAAPASLHAEDEPTRSPVEVIESATAAYQARDRTRFLAHFAEDAIVDANGFSFQGRTQIAEAYAENFTANAPTVEIVDREAYGDRVIDTVEYRQNGYTYCCSVTAYFVENGQITYARVTM